MTGAIRWQESDDKIVTLTLDDPDNRVNTVNAAYIEGLASAVGRLEQEQDRVAGVIVRSAKRSFLAGGDLNRLMTIEPGDLAAFVDDIDVRKAYTRRLELLRCPVVVILNGPALGGGLELALSCHRTIAVDESRVIVGLPEATLGLIPGAGGIVRCVQRLGIDTALDRVLLPGRRFSVAEAVAIGLIDESAESEQAAEAAAIEWIVSKAPITTQGLVAERGARREMPAPSAVPVRRAIIAVANESLHSDVQTALGFESRVFGDVVVSAATKNAIRSHFFATNALRKRARLFAEGPPSRVVIVPSSLDALVRLDEASWHEVVDVLDEKVTQQSSAGSDARVVLEGINESGWPHLWISPDFVGDGQRVVEFSSDGSPAAREAMSGLAKAGVVVIPLVGSTGSFGQHVQMAIPQAIEACMAQGFAQASIDRALRWAGLSRHASPDADHEASGSIEQDSDLACILLGHVAREALASVEAGALTFADDADVASVRAGGFPGWAGGVTWWSTQGRAMVRDLVRVDVPVTSPTAAIRDGS